MTAATWFLLALLNVNGGQVATPYLFSEKADCERAAAAASSVMRASCIPVTNFRSAL